MENNILSNLQFSNSEYVTEYLTEGSWRDAEETCVKKHNMHLWSINSHSEWWNIYHAFATHYITKSERTNNSLKHMNRDLSKLSTTSLLFIGLTVSSKKV